MNRKMSSALILALCLMVGLAPVKTAANLITNSSFDTDAGGWVLFQTATLNQSTFGSVGSGITAPHTGLGSGQLVSTNPVNTTEIYTNTGTVYPQKTYHIILYYKTANLNFVADGRFGIILSFNKSGQGNGSAGMQNFIIATTSLNNNSTWTSFEVDVTVPDGAVGCQFLVSLSNATGTVWIDDISMTERTETTNVILNPTFVSNGQGSLANWNLFQITGTDSYSIVSPGQDDNWSVMLQPTDNLHLNTASIWTVTGAMTQNKNYHISFWYKTNNLTFDSSSAAGLKLVLEFTTAGGAYGDTGSQTNQIYDLPVNSGGWMQFTTDAMTPPLTARCQVVIQLTNACSGGSLGIDNVVMSDNPAMIGPYTVSRPSTTITCLSGAGNYRVSEYACFMAILSDHGQKRQDWYNLNKPSNWYPEQDHYMNELHTAGISKGPAFPWVTDPASELGWKDSSNPLYLSKVAVYHQPAQVGLGFNYPFTMWHNYGLAISQEETKYTDGTSVAGFDPQMESDADSYAVNWFEQNTNFPLPPAPAINNGYSSYVDTIEGEDEPMNNFNSIFSATANPTRTTMLNNASAVIRNSYGNGIDGIWDPYSAEAGGSTSPRQRIATYRWWNAQFATHLTNEANAMTPYINTPPNYQCDYVPFSHDYCATADNIDISVTSAASGTKGKWASADTYPSSTYYWYGQPRCVYHTGFSTKLLCDLSSAANSNLSTRIHIQCFPYWGPLPQQDDIREWVAQALKNGAKWISFYTQGPSKVTMTENNSPYYDGPYREMLRLCKIISGGPAPATQMNAFTATLTNTAILYSNYTKWGNNDFALHSYYSVYSLLGEKAGSWFKFVSDTQQNLDLSSTSLIYLPQIKYLSHPNGDSTSLGETLHAWITSGSSKRLVIFDPEAFFFDIGANGQVTQYPSCRLQILGSGMGIGAYRDDIDDNPYIIVTAAGSPYFGGVAAGTHLPVTPLMNTTHPKKSGKILAYNITPPTGSVVLAKFSDNSATAVYSMPIGTGSEVIYFAVQPFGNSDLAVNDQGWAGFFSNMATLAGDSKGINRWQFQLPTPIIHDSSPAINFSLGPLYQ